MTEKERFIKALKREPLEGHVPTFELVFYLTMEVLGKVHPLHRDYSQWNQMSVKERELHLQDMQDERRFFFFFVIFNIHYKLFWQFWRCIW